ncbi:AMP phosphorylase [Candidatus Pacearchaeota archaeon]|nr:AMP phosphorylase [Candidatus Pacearchaeota archaeon]
MKLKTKFLKWSAGAPTAMLNKKTAGKIGIHSKDRISIRTYSRYPKEMVSLVDTVEGFVRPGEIAVSSEIRKRMKLRKGQPVDINLSTIPQSTFFIKDKLDGKKLSSDQIKEIVSDIVNNSLSQAELSLFVSSMYVRGMDFEETIALIEAILDSGNLLNLGKKVIVDKHSVGGVPGNRTTPIVVAICAAAGLTMPKTSSRSITSAAGTADVIETIARIEFSMDELKKIVQKTNACMVWGGALGMVPADSKILDTEKVLKIDPEAQLLASIMSKKLAVGSQYILIDIPYGKRAKVSKKNAIHLKKKFEKLGKHFKREVRVVLTNGNQPIGNGIGPALELMDILEILTPEKKGPKDLEDKSLFLAGELLEMTEKAKKGKGIKMAKEILESGKALKKFEEIIKAQEGDFSKIKFAKFKKDIFSPKSGKVKDIHNKKINAAARFAGCPIDKSAGLHFSHKLGDQVKKGEKLITIYAESKSRLNSAVNFFHKSKPIRIR